MILLGGPCKVGKIAYISNSDLFLLLCRRVDMSNLNEVEAAVGPKTKVVWLESPTNPRQMICDIRVRVCSYL
jgi:cystathionine beta-lyase/cystathionine gamma-synthase